MSEVPQARVEWKRFGQMHSGLLGDRFEDAGERLAIITCPLCGSPRAAEYAEYMQMLRMAAVVCRGCKGQYTLRWSTSNRGTPAESPPEEESGFTPPGPERDAWGRRDWGTV